MSSRKFYMMDHLKTQPNGIKNTVLTGRVLSLGSRLRVWMPSLAAVWWLKYWKHRSVARPENWLQLPRRDFQRPGSNKGTLKMTQMRLVLGTLPYQRLSDVQTSGFRHCLFPDMFPLQLLEILKSKKNNILMSNSSPIRTKILILIPQTIFHM